MGKSEESCSPYSEAEDLITKNQIKEGNTGKQHGVH